MSGAEVFAINAGILSSPHSWKSPWTVRQGEANKYQVIGKDEQRILYSVCWKSFWTIIQSVGWMSTLWTPGWNTVPHVPPSSSSLPHHHLSIHPSIQRSIHPVCCSPLSSMLSSLSLSPPLAPRCRPILPVSRRGVQLHFKHVPPVLYQHINLLSSLRLSPLADIRWSPLPELYTCPQESVTDKMRTRTCPGDSDGETLIRFQIQAAQHKMEA